MTTGIAERMRRARDILLNDHRTDPPVRLASQSEAAGGFIYTPRQFGKMTESAHALAAAARRQALEDVAEFLQPASYYRAKPHKAPADLDRLQKWLAGQGVEVTG